MLPIFRTNHSLTIQAEQPEKGSWFELWLFKTRLRFRSPKRRGSLPENRFYASWDKRPFLNTESKPRYYKNDGRYSLVEVYSAYWPLAAGRWFSKKTKALLELDLKIFDVADEDVAEFPDLYKEDTGRAWITKLYNLLLNECDEVTLIAEGNGLFEMVFNDDEPRPKVLKHQTFDIDVLSLNSHIAYRLNPAPNKVDYIVPFAKGETLRFSFILNALTSLSAEETNAVLQEASNFSNAIMQTLQLDYSNT
jgi:hypothetical protein